MNKSKSKYPIELVAACLIKEHEKFDFYSEEELCYRKLCCLLYLVEKVSLKTNNYSLFSNAIYASEYGIIIQDFSKKNRVYNITELGNINKEDASIIRNVYKDYGKYSAWFLVDYIKHNDPAWPEAADYSDEGLVYNTISRKFICKNP